MRLGIDRLLEESKWTAALSGRRLGVLGHPASVNRSFVHTLDALASTTGLRLTAAFGPQHGMRGDVQDNMIESADDVDSVHGIPVFSLYGQTRRLTAEMLDTFDVLLVDLQDLGCRIYTFLTTMFYVLEDCAKHGKSVWILDRPNPAGRPVEGRILQPGWTSFVGHAPTPIRHGLTLGELALWFKRARALDVDLEIVAMDGYDPTLAPGYGWPLGELSWVNPSPNAPNLSMARCYAGTVLGEATVLSEGRGTTRPLELMGAPHLEPRALLDVMASIAPEWMEGCLLRPCYFEPTFHKHRGALCRGLQIHVDQGDYRHNRFKPFRLVSLFLRAVRVLHPSEQLWRVFEYEYERDRLAVDLISGSDELRGWVDGTQEASALENILAADEALWLEVRRPYLLYPS
ncbi:MAG: DUF1343 domain-containing protein [Deltaproteobacteria bacterium]|nr:DUF1343 domain-containing protein [Deltaproteobacteria bacterium]